MMSEFEFELEVLAFLETARMFEAGNASGPPSSFLEKAKNFKPYTGELKRRTPPLEPKEGM